MDIENFIETLEDLKANRRLSSESDATIKPFIGSTTEFLFSFIEVSSTLGNRHGDEFKQGKTVLAHFANTELACSILFPPSENEWVESLNKDEEFRTGVVVLEMDNLYQRVVFGKSTRLHTLEESISEEIYTHEYPEGRQSLEEGTDLPSSELHKEDTFVEETALAEQTEESVSEDIVTANKPTDSPSGESGSIHSNPPEDLDKSARALGDDIDDFAEKKDQKKSSTPPALPPPLPESTETKSTVEIDHHYLEELRNKRYEYGESSLTEEEKESLAHDLKVNTPSREKKLKENKNIVNHGARVFFACILIMFSLNSCKKGGGLFGFVVFCIGTYLLIPFLKKLKEINEL